MTVLPLIFDTTPGVGATKLRDAFPYPFLHPRERFETLAAVVTFSRFWAGKLHRHAKIGRVIVHHFHGVSPTEKKTKNTKGRGTDMMIARGTVFRAGDESLGGKRNFGPYGT